MEPRPAPSRDAAQARPTVTARIADGRGLTAAGAAVVMTAFGAAGGAFDVLTGPGLRTVFAVCYVLGCGLAALAVHRENLRPVIVMPPLVYAVLALTAAASRAGDAAGRSCRGRCSSWPTPSCSARPCSSSAS